MRPAPRPCTSAHRARRFIGWARLAFASALGLLFAMLAKRGDPRARRRALDGFARTIGEAIFLAAAARVAPPPSRVRHRHGALKQRGFRRALTGSRLRRAMAGRDGFARLAAMARVLRDIEAQIARLVQRLRRGLTRRRLVRAFANRPAPVSVAFSPPAADSS
jgi:hypothetical protein